MRCRELTKAWLLYLGLIFLFMVMYAPGGIASLIMMNLRVAPRPRPAAAGAALPRRCSSPALSSLLGAAALIEMIYHLQLNAALGPELQLFGVAARRASGATGLASGVACSSPARLAAACALVRACACAARRSRDRSREQARGELRPRARAAATCARRFGKTEIIRGVDLAVAPGERLAIIGPNGAGKSTLFNLISGRFAPSSGEILLNGERIDGLQPFEINRRGLSRSFQITNIFPRSRVFENLRCGVLWSLGYRYSFWQVPRRAATTRNERAEQLLEQIKLRHAARRAGR